MPEMLMDVTIQPVMFVLLFAFVFGGSIAIPAGASYREWLMAGIMGQTIAFASFIVPSASPPTSTRASSTGCARCRSTSAASCRSQHLQPDPLEHRHRGDVADRLVIGWRIRTNVFDALLGYGLLLLWGFA
jgi:hypothetical protein